MKRQPMIVWPAGLAALLLWAAAWADGYESTREAFQNAGASGEFFDTAYGYALFPTIGKGGVGIGGAHGKGRVFRGDEHVGDTSMTQVTVGLQLGGGGARQVL